MKIILLGATGQLGKEWQDFLRPKMKEIGGGGTDLLTYSSSDLDLTNFSAVTEELRKQQPNLVINCAAYTDVDGAEEHKNRAMQVNAGAVAQLASLSARLGFKLVHYSTDYVFPGAEADRKALPEGYPEDHPANPVNWYGQTKWEGEEAIRAATDQFLVLRVSWLCGQFGNNFVKTMLRLGRERDKLQVVNDQWGSPTFARDVVEATFSLVQENKTGTFHITSQGLTNWYEFAGEIFSQRNIQVDVEPVSSDAFPTKATRPQFSKLSAEKIENLPQIHISDWRESLHQLLLQLDT